MNRVLIVGIDALDSQILDRLGPALPTFHSLRQATGPFEFDGVFPPDSPTSWASIFTGLNPAKHGILLFVDPLGRVSRMITQDVDDSTIRGNTFWDVAGRAGKRVCVASHLLGYPPWPVNGVMVGRSGITSDVKGYPPELGRESPLIDFRWDLSLFPGTNKKRFVREARRQIDREVSLVSRIMADRSWDLFFVSFGELDVVQYSFWNHYDAKDPAFKSGSPFAAVIPEFYGVFDGVVGKLKAIAGPDTHLVVVSDHGIGSRPVKLVNVNELIRQAGFIALKHDPAASESGSPSRLFLTPRLKDLMLRTIGGYGLGNLAAVLLRAFPEGKAVFISQQPIDYERSRSYLTDQSGIKVYPYGGIVVKSQASGYDDYEATRRNLVSALQSLRDPTTGEPVFEWVKRREELYHGSFLNRYPDILFELRPQYGAGGVAPASLFGNTSTHEIAPGCHKQHNATLLISCAQGRKLGATRGSLMDVAPTVLDLLGVGAGVPFDGRTLLRKDSSSTN